MACAFINRIEQRPISNLHVRRDAQRSEGNPRVPLCVARDANWSRGYTIRTCDLLPPGRRSSQAEPTPASFSIAEPVGETIASRDGFALAAQYLEQTLEVVVGLEGQYDLPLVLAPDADLDAQTQLLPQFAFEALHVRRFLNGRSARRVAGCLLGSCSSMATCFSSASVAWTDSPRETISLLKVICRAGSVTPFRIFAWPVLSWPMRTASCNSGGKSNSATRFVMVALTKPQPRR